MAPLRSEKILFANEAFRLTATGVFQDGAEAHVLSPHCFASSWHRSPDSKHGETVIRQLPKLSGDYPQYRGDIPILEAAYNLALCELEENSSPDGLLMTGKAWQSVWTRDIAYSVHLSLALAAPVRSAHSLRSRVSNGEIMEDTGTGGSWPVSTDRVAWALAAQSVYLNTGDRDWLQWACAVLQRTLSRDEELIFRDDGLPRGESSFIDWREQSYPDWMTPADIAASCALGTTALHARAHRILADMLTELGDCDEAVLHRAKADRLKVLINEHFWQEERKQYGSFLYGRLYETLAPRSDALAESLCILFGIAEGERAEDVMAHLPRSPYGTPVYSPFKSSIAQPYHNRAVWPFEEAYALWAAAAVGNLDAASLSMASLLRAALLFGTNKENISLAHHGDCFGTALNSDRQLWSLAGMLSLFYHNIFGLSWEGNTLIFNPTVPREYGGNHWLTGIRLRGFSLDIRVHGYGSEICACMINGQDAPPVIPADATGHFIVELELNPMEESLDHAPAFPVATFDLPEPNLTKSECGLIWDPIEGADAYIICRNGSPFTQVTETHYTPLPSTAAVQYQIQAVSADGRESFLSKPQWLYHTAERQTLTPAFIGREGKEFSVEGGQAWLDTKADTRCLSFSPLRIEESGDFSVEIQYCNATESKRDGNTCALRDLFADDAFCAVIPMPHNTERSMWADFSLTSPVRIHLERGIHRLSLQFSERNRNINGYVNQCMVRQLILTRLGSLPQKTVASTAM